MFLIFIILSIATPSLSIGNSFSYNNLILSNMLTGQLVFIATWFGQLEILKNEKEEYLPCPHPVFLEKHVCFNCASADNALSFSRQVREGERNVHINDVYKMSGRFRKSDWDLELVEGVPNRDEENGPIGMKVLSKKRKCSPDKGDYEDD